MSALLKEGVWIEWSDEYGSLRLRIDSFRDTEIVATTYSGHEYRIDPADIAKGRIRVLEESPANPYNPSSMLRVIKELLYYEKLKEAQQKIAEMYMIPLTDEMKKTLEETMEKYGVATPKKPDGEKSAGKDQDCPSCGSEVDKTSPQPHCPTDGTKPFETPKAK